MTTPRVLQRGSGMAFFKWLVEQPTGPISSKTKPEGIKQATVSVLYSQLCKGGVLDKGKRGTYIIPDEFHKLTAKDLHDLWKEACKLPPKHKKKGSRLYGKDGNAIGNGVADELGAPPIPKEEETIEIDPVEVLKQLGPGRAMEILLDIAIAEALANAKPEDPRVPELDQQLFHANSELRRSQAIIERLQKELITERFTVTELRTTLNKVRTTPAPMEDRRILVRPTSPAPMQHGVQPPARTSTMKVHGRPQPVTNPMQVIRKAKKHGDKV